MRRTAATYPTITAWIGCLALTVAAASCKTSTSNQGSGGSPATGGSSGAGGTSNSSASSASGGSSATGGSTSAGGSSATGGSTSAGGSSESGGSTASGGSSATGGATDSGGSSATGGSTGSGGSSATGGATGAGGSSAAGGSTGAGGSSAAGGATSAGGATGSGGSSATGGTTPALGCSAALIPPNGNVTDFSDWDVTAGKWGNTSGFYGAVFSYGGLTQAVDAFNKNFHITGTLPSGAFGGAGLSFNACATVTTFNSLSFTIAGSAPGCDIDLQIQTFDQLPKTNAPPGGCDPSVTSCYGFPSKGRVAIPAATPAPVTTVLGSLSNWSQANAAQVVGIQWQFSVPQVADGGTAISCPIDVTIDDVKFVP